MDDLNAHLFDVIERLKSADDPEADPKDTIKPETAGLIVDTAKVIVEVAKVKVSALKLISATENPANYAFEQGLLEDPLKKE